MYSDEGNGFCRAFLLHFKLLHIYNKESKLSEFKTRHVAIGDGVVLHFLYQKGSFVLCNVQANGSSISVHSTFRNITICLKIHFPVSPKKLKVKKIVCKVKYM